MRGDAEVFRTQQAAAGGSCVDQPETTRVRFSFNSVSNLCNRGASRVPKAPAPAQPRPAAGENRSHLRPSPTMESLLEKVAPDASA